VRTLWRVAWWLPDAQAGQPGHPNYLPPQGAGRVDNPDLYRVRYLAGEPEAAVGETLGDFARWTDPDLLTVLPRLPGAVRALLRCELADGARIADLDDPALLLRHRLRPSRVVTRDRAVTQRWAAELYRQHDDDGLSWWSAWWPDWSVYAVWALPQVTVTEVTPLSLTHPAVRQAAATLNRPVG